MNSELTELDIKALNFRDELIKLCEKYDCNIDGDVNVDEESCVLLLIKDESNNNNSELYELQDFNYDIYKKGSKLRYCK